MLHSTTHNEEVWIASRQIAPYTSTDNKRVQFIVRTMVSNGGIGGKWIYDQGMDGHQTSAGATYGVRPVIILKSGIKATPIGTEGNSWKLN